MRGGRALTGMGVRRLGREGKKKKEGNGMDEVLKEMKGRVLRDGEFNVVDYGGDGEGMEV
ncbi:hypothetical protein [Bacillus pumilus]|uniref:hypothetical protein n=1 Tax=Bacillus pumilus TaxID=1408 RepID=UPI00119D79AB|nr:hypothetical protein [Bacillus pumilus]